MAIRRNTLKVKGRVKTKSQLKQQSKIKSNRSLKDLVDHKSKGTGKYAKRSSTPLTARQAYKLEKRSLVNERYGMETKPELIRAAGQALAMNVSPATASYGATAGTAKIIESTKQGSNDTKNINNLINGGVNQAGNDNDEEYQDSLPGGAMIR